MSTFTNRTIKSTYDQLLHIEGDQIQNGLGANLYVITDHK